MADFYCPEAALVVQMASARASERGLATRADAFESQGYRVVRLSEYELIDDMEAAVRKIRGALGIAPAKVRPLRHLH